MKKTTLAALFAASFLAAETADAFVLVSTSPGKWGDPIFGSISNTIFGTSVTYSFMPTGTSCSVEGGGCTITALGQFGPSFTVWRSEIQNAFASWSAASSNFLRFIEVPDDGAAFNGPTTGGDIRLGGHSIDGPFGRLVDSYFPPVNGLTAAGDIHFDTGECWETTFDGTGDGCFSIFQVAMHEIGHVLGLDHTGVPGSLMNPFYTEAFVGPQADDIEGIQFIYGSCPRDPATGIDTQCTPIFDSLPQPPSVPLPSTLSLMGLGLAAAGLSALRRRRV